MAKGPLAGISGDRCQSRINDGASHSVDSSDMAFQAAARGAFHEAYRQSQADHLEPIMKVVVETPTEFQGSVMGSLNQRRGMIVGAQDEGSCA
jgi:elongation factor G